MVFRDKVDVLYDPKVTSSRRRIEYPSLDDKVMKIFLAKLDDSNPGASETKVKEGLMAVIEEEKKHIKLEQCVHSHYVSVFVDLGGTEGAKRKRLG